MTRTTLLLVLGYAAVLAAAATAVVETRRRTIATLDTPEARAEWNSWRAETKKLSQEQGPAMRRPAKAVEPPMLILLRDHFPMALGSTLVAATLFYWLMVVLIRGSLQTPPLPDGVEPETLP